MVAFYNQLFSQHLKKDLKISVYFPNFWEYDMSI